MAMRKIFLLFLLAVLLPLSGKCQTFVSLNGENISFEEMISGPKTVLFMWATWCPACRESLKELNDSADLPDDVNFYYVTMGEKESKVRRLVEDLKLKDSLKDKVILDQDMVLSNRFSITVLPTYIFFKNGVPLYWTVFISKEVMDEVFKDE